MKCKKIDFLITCCSSCPFLLVTINEYQHSRDCECLLDKRRVGKFYESFTTMHTKESRIHLLERLFKECSLPDSLDDSKIVPVQRIEDAFLDKKIDDLPKSYVDRRVITCLGNMEPPIETIGDLFINNITERHLKKIKNFGRKSLYQLTSYLKYNGYTLGEK